MSSDRDFEVEVKRSLKDDLCQHSFQTDVTTYEDLKDIIFKKSVRAKLLFVVGAGLPYSGTSSLIRGILKLPQLEPQSQHSLTTFSTVFFKDSVKNDGHFVVLDDDNDTDGMLLLALTKLLITKQFKIQSLQDTGNLFLHNEVNDYFKGFCKRLLRFVNDVSDNGLENNPLVPITRSQSFIKFLDITVNKAIYECLFIVGSWCKNGFLLNVLNLYYYSREKLECNLDLSQPYFPEDRYKQEDISLLKIHSACHFFLSIFEGTFSKTKDSKRAIVVYSHQDKLDPQAFQAQRQEVTDFIEESLKSSKIGDNCISSYVAISNQEGKDRYKEVLQHLISLIEKHLGHNHYIHLKDMFFYSYLKSKNKMCLSKEQVITYGMTCNMSVEAINESLKLLHNSCFVFVMKGLVIFDLSQFIEGISLLYYIRNGNATSALLCDFDNGFLKHRTLSDLWGELCDLYVNTLKEAGLMVELQHSDYDFFMPSLRVMYEQEKVSSYTASLLILSDTTIIPFHIQCIFIKVFQNAYPTQPVEILPSRMYNVLRLHLHQIVELKILFCEKFLEISIDLKGASSILEKQETDAYYYSSVKTMCAKVLNNIRENKSNENFDFSSLRYCFAVCCPRSSPTERHYITFQDTVREPFWCCICKDNVDIMDERCIWLSSPCTSTSLHFNDHLNFDNVNKITKLLLESNSPNLLSLCHFLDDINQNRSDVNGTKIECELDDLSDKIYHTIYTWHLLNKSNSKINFAKLLHENGFEKEAFVIEPLLKKWLAQEPTYTPITEKEIMECAELWKGTCIQLAQLLKVNAPACGHSEVPDQENFVQVIRSWIKANPYGSQYQKLFHIISNPVEK